jgi:hypothetical protein
VSISANRTLVVSFLLVGVARADYFDPGPAIGGCPASATNCVDTRVTINGVLKSCGQLTSQELVDLDATLHTKVACHTQRCYRGTVCNAPGAATALPPNPPICCGGAGQAPCLITRNDTQSTSGGGAQISCPRAPLGSNCINGTQLDPAFRGEFFDCYGCYDPTEHVAALDPNDPGTRYEVSRFYTTQCEQVSGTNLCNYVGGLVRVRGNFYNPRLDQPNPPASKQFPPQQQQIEQIEDTAGCLSESVGNPQCATNGCGPLQDLTTPAAQSRCSTECTTLGCANPECTNPGCATQCTNSSCFAMCSVNSNWECVKVNGTKTCVIDKTPTYRDTALSSTVRQQSDGDGATYGVGLVVGSASNFSDDCGAPTESLRPDAVKPWFNRTTLGDRSRQVCWGDTTLALSASELPTARDLGNWILTCSDDVAVTCDAVALTPPTTAETLYSTTCHATDLAGNQQTATLGIEVQPDATPPAITCPADVTLECDSPSGASHSPWVADATDDCPLTVSSSPSRFPLGTTSVQYSASDGINTSSCSQNVTVADTTPPSFAAFQDQTVVGNASGTPVSFALPAATDACWGMAGVTCTPVSGNSFGDNTVASCTATDGSGNRTTVPNPFHVTVLEPLQVVFDPPVSGAAGVTNRFKVGQTIPFKVHLVDTSGMDVTGSVTVKLAVSAGASGSSGDLINDVIGNGVGDLGGIMVPVDGHYQFNLPTSWFPAGHLYQALVTVTYDWDSTATAAGQASAVLQSR